MTFLMSSGKLFHLLITLKLKKFLLISRLHSVKFRFILRVENLVSRRAVSTDLVNHVPFFHYHVYRESSKSVLNPPLLFFLLRWSSWPPLVDQGIRYYAGLKSSSKLLFFYLAMKEVCILAGNHQYKETDSMYFVQSSLNSHPLLVGNPWKKVSLHLQFIIFWKTFSLYKWRVGEVGEIDIRHK